MLKYTGHYGTPDRITADVHIIPFPSDAPLFQKTLTTICPHLKTLISGYRDNGDFTGKAEETTTIATVEGRYILTGLGSAQGMTAEQVRRAMARGIKQASLLVAPVVALYCPLEELVKKTLPISFEETVVAMLEGAALASYRYHAFIKDKPDEKKGKIRELKVVTVDEGYQSRMKDGIHQAAVIIEAVEFARNLSNAPANVMDAETLAKEALALGKKLTISTVVLNKKEIVANKMGGLLAVNQGSRNEPRFIVMEYNDKKRRLAPYVLVGKGVTFDSGGLCLKPAASMDEMKMDMSGAAAVLGTMMAVARLKLPIRVIALIPATDNMTGGAAFRPGDVITIADGTTVEVKNTDAEGRLILADALVYAQRYKPAAVIDLATLTGAVVVALASAATGMFGNDDELKTAITDAGARTFERVWELPLFEEYGTLLKSDIADVSNLGGKWGGACTAAAFLQRFVGDVPWIHLDIAGTAMLDTASDYQPKGGTGVGVRLLTEFLRTRA
ncbi:MAG: leucyl aminopeptidase [Bacteroidota bacterium]|jgi:leucyl aminopeptidase|nr:leucyl aminopeptidase [Bacteroidota bacterium]